MLVRWSWNFFSVTLAVWPTVLFRLSWWFRLACNIVHLVSCCAISMLLLWSGSKFRQELQAKRIPWGWMLEAHVRTGSDSRHSPVLHRHHPAFVAMTSKHGQNGSVWDQFGKAESGLAAWLSCFDVVLLTIADRLLTMNLQYWWSWSTKPPFICCSTRGLGCDHKFEWFWPFAASSLLNFLPDQSSFPELELAARDVSWIVQAGLQFIDGRGQRLPVTVTAKNHKCLYVFSPYVLQAKTGHRGQSLGLPHGHFDGITLQ